MCKINIIFELIKNEKNIKQIKIKDNGYIVNNFKINTMLQASNILLEEQLKNKLAICLVDDDQLYCIISNEVLSAYTVYKKLDIVLTYNFSNFKFQHKGNYKIMAIIYDNNFKGDFKKLFKKENIYSTYDFLVY